MVWFAPVAAVFTAKPVASEQTLPEAALSSLMRQLRRALTDLVGKVSAKFLGAAPHCFVAHDNSASGEKMLDHFQSERKPSI